MSKQKDIPITFGKYKGRLLCDVPNSYLEWLVGEKWFKTNFAELKEQADIEIAYRKKFDINIKE